ncbi:MAG: hypothetical protein PHG66_03370 [Candidatus Colwellbacteria bacterium]|nr:hypothetical protein [Candidatus Colwellbacteria bacterium]
MIDDKTKQKLLKELEKSGNVFLSCLKTGIDKSTYYRWRNSDKEFRKLAGQAIQRGRENNCDIAEHALMLKVKDKDMTAIKYVLGHNDQRYKSKQTSNVVIFHKKELPPVVEQITAEDVIDSFEENLRQKTLRLKEELTMFGGEIPNKPDGSPIEDYELSGYEGYIRDWQKHKKIKEI